MASVPVALAITSVVLTAAGTATAIVAAEQQAQAASDAAKADRDLAAAEAKRSAAQKRKEMERQNRIDFLNFLNSGIRASEGTPLAVLSFNAAEREQEALDIELFGINRAILASNRARAARTGGTNAAIGTGLSGVGSAASTGASLLTRPTIPTDTTD
jgi:hypothetical protein